MTSPRANPASVTMTTAVAASGLLLIGSMRAYPGGTEWEPASQGNDFWLNYLCDLARASALNGAPNPVGSLLARAAMVLLSVALASAFWLVPSLFAANRRLGAWVRWLGIAASVGSIGVVLLPADRFGHLHAFAIIVAGVPGLTAASLALVGLVGGRGTLRAAAVVGAIMLAVAAVDFALYVRQLFEPYPGPRAVAVLEKLSLLLLVAWMGLIACATRVKRPARIVQAPSRPY